VYNIIGLTLAALGILPPILAAAAQSLPDLGILANSSRLLRYREQPKYLDKPLDITRTLPEKTVMITDNQSVDCCDDNCTCAAQPVPNVQLFFDAPKAPEKP
nr:hypothetical protein [Anaerolineae bacterium]